jgi:hypothetical protein
MMTTADIDIAVQEGFDAPELVKRFTTVGMAPDQQDEQRQCGVDAAQIRDVSPARRHDDDASPYEPVNIAALAGRFQARWRG